MENELLQVLPNLGVGVAAVTGIVLVVRYFLAALDSRAQAHEAAMDKRENAFRSLEKDMRDSLVNQLVKNTQVMERVMDHLNAKH